AAFFAALVLALAPSPAHAQTPSIDWEPAASSNYQHGRSGTSIDMIIIHKADGSYDGTVSWFKDSAAKVSAHYTVGDDQIAQSVDDANMCFHCGNTPYNHRSIGIENSGWTFRD